MVKHSPMWPVACFFKVLKLFGCILGDTILSVSSKPRHLTAWNFMVVLIFIPFTAYQRTSFTEQAGQSYTNGFSGPKSFRDFRGTGPCIQFLAQHQTWVQARSRNSSLDNVLTQSNNSGNRNVSIVKQQRKQRCLNRVFIPPCSHSQARWAVLHQMTATLQLHSDNTHSHHTVPACQGTTLAVARPDL